MSDLLLQESLEQLLAFFRQLVFDDLSGILGVRCGNVHVQNVAESTVFSELRAEK